MTQEESALAADYVLGTLNASSAELLRARIAQDEDLAREVAMWERRLAPLAVLVPPVPPPEGLWARIEASIEPPAKQPAANDNRLLAWRTATAASLAIAACLAAFVLLRPLAAPSYAVLAPLKGAPPILVAMGAEGGTLMVRPSGGAIKIAPDRDLELWALAKGAAKPLPLGVLPAGGMQIGHFAAGTQLLVSVEPKGGSPTGLPTGPVIYGGVLASLE